MQKHIRPLNTVNTLIIAAVRPLFIQAHIMTCYGKKKAQVLLIKIKEGSVLFMSQWLKGIKLSLVVLMTPVIFLRGSTVEQCVVQGSLLVSHQHRCLSHTQRPHCVNSKCTCAHLCAPGHAGLKSEVWSGTYASCGSRNWQHWQKPGVKSTAQPDYCSFKERIHR